MVDRFGRKVAQEQEEDQIYEPRQAPQRILVPLANPSTSETLMNIASMLRDSKSEETIFPLTVVAEELEADNTESNVAAAERLLAHAVVHAAEIDVPVNPVTRVARNPASGIVEAATERRVSDIVIGWNGARSAQQRIFGTVIDQMLEQSSQQVWVCKLEHSVNTFQRLVVVMPPLVDHNPGFYEAVRSLKQLASQLGATIQALVVGDNADRFRQHFSEVAIEVDAAFMEVSTWQALETTLHDTVNDKNLMVLLSAREGTIAYERSLSRLPQMLADLHASFLVLYPSEKELRSVSIQPQGLPDILTENRVVLDLATPSYEKTVDVLLSTAIDTHDPRHNSVLKALVYDDVGYASEVLPGVIISHARVRELKETKMFLGIHREGVKHDRIQQPVHVVILLLSPAQRTTQEHLSQLAEIARYFSHVDDLDRLTLCRNLEELRAWFEQNGGVRSR
ncbi:PTS sugar transporter subunit IIA [Egbenema bharatensis]|uniref:PTS sugar transporter subunit IIA n=1 Tax=Egbenema bharatensis TaxID=3463334 RepID=UPI003A852DBB